MSENKNNRKKIVIIVIAVLLVVAAAAAAAVMIFFREKPEEPPKETKGVVGIIRDDWDPNLPEDASSNTASKKGTQIPGYSTAEMKEGDTSLRLSIGNPKDNQCGFFATVKLEDGTVLYESPLLQPGQGIDEIPITQTLKKGTYSAYVYYQCVLLDEENTPLNAAESVFTLIVK